MSARSRTSWQGPALVTGATGYIGRALVRRMTAEGRAVHALVRSTSDTKGLPVGCRVHHCDGDMRGLMRLVRSVRPTTIFHLASLVLSSQHTSDLVDPLLEANVVLGARLAEAATVGGVARFINTGSFSQRMTADGYDPLNLYAAAKQACQDLLEYYANATPLRVMTLVLFDTYGPDDSRPKIVNLLGQAYRLGKSLDLSPGRQRMDLVHIDDVVSAFLHAERLMSGSAVPRSGAVYAVRSGRAPTLREIVEICAKAWGGRPVVRFGGRPYRPREVMKPWPGPILPGWRARIKPEIGLRDVLG